jgi:hypothetical protein
MGYIGAACGEGKDPRGRASYTRSRYFVGGKYNFFYRKKRPRFGERRKGRHRGGPESGHLGWESEKSEGEERLLLLPDAPLGIGSKEAYMRVCRPSQLFLPQFPHQ